MAAITETSAPPELLPTQTAGAGAASDNYGSVLGDVSRLLEQPHDQRLANLERYARCVTMRFRRRAASQEEMDLRKLMPDSLARSPEVWEYTSCAICLTDFADGEELRRGPCAAGHAFHPKCLRGWLDRSHSTCPVCRGCEETRSATQQSASARQLAAVSERPSPDALAEYVMRRMRAGKADMSISATNHKRAARIVRQMRDPMPLMCEGAPDRGQDEKHGDVPNVASILEKYEASSSDKRLGDMASEKATLLANGNSSLVASGNLVLQGCPGLPSQVAHHLAGSRRPMYYG